MSTKKKLKFNPNLNDEVHKYLLAGAAVRIWARFIDICFLFIIGFFGGVGIFYSNVATLNLGITYTSFIPMLFGHNLSNYTPDVLSVLFIGWKYCAYSWLVFFSFSVWFLIIPYFWKGRTVGDFFCKITTVNLSENNKHFFWRLIQKEFLLWILMSFILIIYGFVCLGLNQVAYKFNLSYINNANTNGFKSFDTVYLFVFLFSIMGLIEIIVILWMIFRNNKACLQDDLSHTVVIYINKLEESKQEKDVKYNKNKERKFFLPGEVDLKEIDKLTNPKRK